MPSFDPQQLKRLKLSDLGGESVPTVVQPLPEDRYRAAVSRDLTPWRVGQILETANGGDPREQSQLCEEILEKDWDVAQAVQTRTGAVLGTGWDLTPADETPRAQEVADAVRLALQQANGGGQPGLTDFRGLLSHLLGAVLPGLAVAEQVWRPGGAGLLGWQVVESRHLTFRQSWQPLLVTRDEPQGVELPAPAFVVHRHQSARGDLARGGLVRPLAWLYVFKLLVWKDRLRTSEKFGTPYVAANVSAQAWDTDRTKVAYALRNFGSDGGGVFTDAVKLHFLEAGAQTGQLHAELVADLKAAVQQVVLGQTLAAGSDGGGSGSYALGKVHGEIRQDLLEADCVQLAATLQRQLVVPLVHFLFGPAAPVPQFHFACEPPEDQAAQAGTLKTLKEAGLQVKDLGVLTPVFGWELERVAEPGVVSLPGAPAAPAGEGVAAAPDLQKSALNGAQVQAAQQVVQQVAAGQLPRDAAQKMLERFFQLTPEEADGVLGSVGKGFVPATPAPAAALSADADAGEALASLDQVTALGAAAAKAAVQDWLRPAEKAVDAWNGEAELPGLVKLFTSLVQNTKGDKRGREGLQDLLARVWYTAAALGRATEAELLAAAEGGASPTVLALSAELLAAEPPGLLTLDAANEWLLSRELLPTVLNSRQLAFAAEFPAQVRQQVVFSSRVSSATVLDELNRKVQAFAAGETDVATARWQLKEFLKQFGYSPENPLDPTDERRGLDHLASTQRLNLILRQNAAQAHSVGRYQVQHLEPVQRVWPSLRYWARDDAREGHRRFHGLVLPKDSPFWQGHTPPWEFGCRCFVFNATAKEQAAAGSQTLNDAVPNAAGVLEGRVRLPSGAVVRYQAAQSGFAFRPDLAAPNVDGALAAVDSDELRAALEAQFQEDSRES